MAVAQVVDVRLNPNDASQRIVLWGNGRIDVKNSGPVTDGPQWLDRIDQPVAVAIHVTAWGATTAGYVLDKNGAVHPFGGAPSIGTAHPLRPEGSKAELVDGIPYWPTGIYVDWSWDTYNPGRGVALDGYGTLHAFGGAPAPFRTGNRWPVLVARKLKMSWGPTDMRAITMDYSGGLHADYSAVLPSSGPYWAGQDIARDFEITNWANGAGFLMDLFGGMHTLGNTTYPPGFPYLPGSDIARALKVLSPSNPARFLQVWGFGQEFEWVASTPPAVVAGGSLPSPATTVTDSTRPVLAWAYTDAQNDLQDEWEVAVFTQAYVNANPSVATDPWAHLWAAVVFETGRDPHTRGIVATRDLANGAHRMYVRVRDTAGQWSSWATRGWTQSITLPATPTGLTATADQPTATVFLSVSATPSSTAKLVRFDCSDDAGTTWMPVDGAEAVAIAATTTAVDRFPPQGKPRTYRAVAYSNDPRVASSPSGTAAATVDASGYFITSVDAPNAGGRLQVQEPVAWERNFVAGVFQGLGAKYPTVVRDGGEPKASRGTVHLLSLDEEEWAKVESLADAGSTLVYRDPFGVVRYCELVGGWPQELLPGSAMQHRHTTELPLVEVAPPHMAA